MEWETVVSIGLLLTAYLGAYYQSWRDNWERYRKVGSTVVLLGAIVGLYLDDLLPSESPALSWVKPVAALLVLAGLFVLWFWSQNEADEGRIR